MYIVLMIDVTTPIGDVGGVHYPLHLKNLLSVLMLILKQFP